MIRVTKIAALSLVIGILGSAGVVRAGESYGQPLTEKETVSVSTILDKPHVYVGKAVKVEGLIVDVCSRRGCWMELAGDRPYEKIKIKVADGVIVFPLSARGKKATVQGTLEELRMTVEEAREYYKHQALEGGREFDPATVMGAETIYRIIATGAVIE